MPVLALAGAIAAATNCAAQTPYYAGKTIMIMRGGGAKFGLRI